MGTFIVRRLLYAVLIIIIVSIIVFLLLRALPGDPIMMLIAQNPEMEWTEEMIETLREQTGLGDPLPVQYFKWISKIIRGDFGNSIMYGYKISDQIKSRVVVSMTLGITAWFFAMLIGPLLGIICAIRRGKLIDNVIALFANIGITAPQFWIAMLLIFLFSMRLEWLPIYGYTLPWIDFKLSVKQSILPVFVTALGPIASSARQTRSSVLEVLGEDYVRTAWAKGLNERKVLLKHVFKNSLMPIVTLQAGHLRTIVGGSMVIERVFVIPGMGKFLVDALMARDYTIVQAVTVIMTAVIVLSMLLLDLAYGWVDPRIQYE